MPHNERARSISAGWFTVEYVTRSGEVWGWGDNSVGELGTGGTTSTNTPVRAHLPAHFVASSGGRRDQQLPALGTDTRTRRTRVLAWGDNSSGELGDPGVSRSMLPIVTQIPQGAAPITCISAGGVASGAVDADGTAYSWGGNDALPDQPVPTALALPAGVRAVSLSMGTIFSLVTTSTNQLFGWGLNEFGALGPHIPTAVTTPTAVPLPAGTIAGINNNLATSYVILRRP